VLPKSPAEGAVVAMELLFCAVLETANGLAFVDGALKSEPEKPAVPVPFVAGAGAGAEAAKGFDVPAEKSNDDCILKPELAFALPPPNEGKDEFVKVVFGVGACVGGKLFVGLPPNNAPPGDGCCCVEKAKGFDELSPVGAEAPKLKPDDCVGCCGSIEKLELCVIP